MAFVETTQTPPAALSSQWNEPIIQVKDVSKMYLLFNQPVDRLKQILLSRFGRSFGREFWALKDVAFDIQRGESLGILGRNGSGKSTLLQIIAGVLQPTRGQVAARGRISALLELGSGFNPEYSGRENVYLGGAIMGYTRGEMDARIGDILAFADIGDFIDQPVKTYSSGMFARLAFSLAISVDPDILIVDEILSVGDYGFQQKCITRLRQMIDRGLTLLFVSHSPDSIKDLCTRGIFLKEGELVYAGSAENAADEYLRYVREISNQERLQKMPELNAAHKLETNVPYKLRYGTGHVQVEKVVVTDEGGNLKSDFIFGEMICIHVVYKAIVDTDHISVGFSLRDNTGITVTGTTSFEEKAALPDLKAGEQGYVCFRFPSQLRHGNYGVSVAINRVSQADLSDAIHLDGVYLTTHFQVVHNPERPIWYKFHSTVVIDKERPALPILDTRD